MLLINKNNGRSFECQVPEDSTQLGEVIHRGNALSDVYHLSTEVQVYIILTKEEEDKFKKVTVDHINNLFFPAIGYLDFKVDKDPKQYFDEVRTEDNIKHMKIDAIGNAALRKKEPYSVFDDEISIGFMPSAPKEDVIEELDNLTIDETMKKEIINTL